MMLFERTMLDIEAACKKLGWERMGEGSDSGMVIGTSEYVKGIEGALVGAALHGIGGRVCEEPSDSPIDKVCPSGLAIPESPQEATVGPDEGLVAPKDGAENHGETHPNTWPGVDQTPDTETFLTFPSRDDAPDEAAPKSKTVGRILGAVNGKPVGMLSQAPEEG